MTLDELLTSLRQRGIKVSVTGDRLRIETPPGAVTEELRIALARHKRELLDRLRAQGGAARSGFRYAVDELEFGDVCAGWTPCGWANELRRKAARCDRYRPDIGSYYRAWALDIEQRLPCAREWEPMT